MDRKQLNKFLKTQKPLILAAYEVEFINGKFKLFSFGYFNIFRLVEVFSYFVLIVGVSTVIFVNFSENPLVTKVDAASVLESTATQLNGELTQDTIPLDTINASIIRIDYAINVAREKNLKEYVGKSNVDYIAELTNVREILSEMKLAYIGGKPPVGLDHDLKLKAVMVGFPH